MAPQGKNCRTSHWGRLYVQSLSTLHRPTRPVLLPPHTRSTGDSPHPHALAPPLVSQPPSIAPHGEHPSTPPRPTAYPPLVLHLQYLERIILTQLHSILWPYSRRRRGSSTNGDYYRRVMRVAFMLWDCGCFLGWLWRQLMMQEIRDDIMKSSV